MILATDWILRSGGARLWQVSAAQPLVMGILNCTPDSFHASSRIADEASLLHRAETMLSAGADILDIGAVSTRPDAPQVSEADEWARLETPLRSLLRAFPQTLVSVDTFRASIAQRAADLGVSIINDVTGGDEAIWRVAAQYGLTYILTHLRGALQNMQQFAEYADVTVEVYDYFRQRLDAMASIGVYDVVLDVGFGFAKTAAHNYQLLRQLSAFRHLNCPLLVGVSRKSMIYRPLQISSEESLSATTALHLYALEQGAQILRVHDVKEARQAVQLWHLING